MRARFVFVGIAFLALSIIFSFGVPAQAIGNCGMNDLFLKESDNNTNMQVCSPTAPYTEKATWIWGGLSSTSRTCDGSNVVVRLSDDGSVGGAHAARPDLPDPGGYATPVCYGNLRCGNNSAVFGPNCLYSIASDSNAHISTCDFPTYMNIYCKDVGGAGPICGNGICEAGETNANCPVDCPAVGGGCPAPSAEILAPPTNANCNMFGVSGMINFSQRQERNDSCFDYLWDFGDGTTAGSWNATHQYAMIGQRHIVLTVTRKSDLIISGDEVSILVVDQSMPKDMQFYCAKISDPHEGDIFNTSQYVLFSGNRSYAVVIQDTGSPPRKLKCLAGDCPECVVNPDGSGVTGCTGAGAERIDIPPSWGDLDDPKRWNAVNFLWEFGDGSIYFNLSINGSIYNKLFASPGTYTNKMTMMNTSNPDNNGTDSVTIAIEYGPGCYNNKKLFVDSLGNEFPTNTDANGDGVSDFAQCGGLDGDPATTGDNCCAGSEGWRCYGSDPADTDPAKINHCVKDLPPGFCSGIRSCGNYTNSADCTADVCGVRDNGGFVAPEGWVIVEGSCRCAWNSTTNICASRCNINQSYPKRGSPGIGDCIKTYTQGPCVSGQFVLSWIASLTGINDPGGVIAGALGCTTDSKTYSCGRIAKLAFFTLRNVIGVIVLLIAFYLIINRKKIAKRFGKK